jgi:hypothetical protein
MYLGLPVSNIPEGVGLARKKARRNREPRLGSF